MTIAEPPILTTPLSETDKPRVKRFTKAEYRAVDDAGGFDRLGSRVYLFRGELIEVPPMTWDHATGVQRVSAYAYRVVKSTFEVRVQLPFDAPGDSEPEPDVGIFTPAQTEHRPHPNAAELLVEVAFTSQEDDARKAIEYAGGAAEYWILDVPARVLRVYRNPHPDPASPFGKAFDAPTTLAETDTVAPLCDPAATVLVADLLPPA